MKKKITDIALYLDKKRNQNKLLKHLNETLDLHYWIESPIQFDRNQIRLEFMGNESIEYLFAKVINRFFESQGIEIMEYTLNSITERKDENFITNIEFTIKTIIPFHY